MESTEEVLDPCGGGVIRDEMPFETPVIPAEAGIRSDISSWLFQSVGAMEGLKMNEQCGNVHENKRPLWKTGWEAGMSMKTN